eukprot:TRINITY_DN7306_c0_g1_i2.p2 TRINITY_DN7306_c0_g1~~TRINITY_DN7306_c0_g1_i2.p2  ORF type:complete len:217 (-),score=38.43 TRINITY_DN7306_c0_g1_i2:47-697(-)
MRLAQSAAVTLWNMLDASEILMEARLIQRLFAAACRTLHRVVRHELVQPTYAVTCGSCEDLDLGELAEVQNQEDQHSRQLRALGLVNTLAGLMWNIPVTPDYRVMMAQHPCFVPGLQAILDNSLCSRTHFTCLHLLATLRHFDQLPQRGIEVLHRHLPRFVEGVNPEDASELGVLLSLRDLVDFFLPLIRSRKLECVAFGAWSLQLYYDPGCNAGY